MYFPQSSYERWLWDNAFEDIYNDPSTLWTTYLIQKRRYATRYGLVVQPDGAPPDDNNIRFTIEAISIAQLPRRFADRFNTQELMAMWEDPGMDPLFPRIIEDEELLEGVEMPVVKKKSKEPGKPFLERELSNAFQGVFRWNLPCKEIGIEIEVEGEDLFREPISYWNAVLDPSLRAVNGHAPVEYVLKKPLNRDEIGKALKYLDMGLRKSRIQMSHRTSVHIHINCRDMQMMKLINFICLYWILEGLLIEWSGPNRKGNLFCLRAQDAEWQVAALAKACQTFNFGEVFHEQYRYSAANMASLLVHGSLEFRSMEGTTDIDHIEDWVQLLTAIKDRAIKFKNPSEIGTLFMTVGPERFLRQILHGRVKDSTFDWLAGHGNLEELLNTAFDYAKDACYAIDWDADHKKEIGQINRNRIRQNIEDEDY